MQREQPLHQCHYSGIPLCFAPGRTAFIEVLGPLACLWKQLLGFGKEPLGALVIAIPLLLEILKKFVTMRQVRDILVVKNQPELKTGI